ncbi:hypothetical protein [Haloflavibacter putidus]|uniref:Uncharacterized protein n=1 Tax=Haloflavibacter putidus TaxID=2576776 RepID=A0A507Z7V8_9FLAO|nr:hypothetical protein [Haloflavibacter putidus]TQD33806.1 hypothetical protein FKR84_12670 [Haloflavibacter putidus]
MASQESFIKIKGNIEGLSFYKGADGAYYVRSKGGIDKNRIKNDPAFKRTRENGREFAHINTSGKLLRRAIANLLASVRDRTKSYRLTQVLSRIKNLDTTSNRGERKVHIGMQTPEGKDQLRFFDFNQSAGLDQVLKKEYSLDATNGQVDLLEFNPELNLKAPEGATHVKFQAGHLKFDFETGESDLVLSNTEQLELDENETDVHLIFGSVPTGNGLDYYFLKVEFQQQLNGTFYMLNNGAHNALQIIEVV